MNGERAVKKFLEGKQGGGRKKIRSGLRWMDDVELNLRNIGVKLVRTSVLDRIERASVVRETKAKCKQQ
jgi:hypothetical protein